MNRSFILAIASTLTFSVGCADSEKGSDPKPLTRAEETQAQIEQIYSALSGQGVAENQDSFTLTILDANQVIALTKRPQKIVIQGSVISGSDIPDDAQSFLELPFCVLTPLSQGLAAEEELKGRTLTIDYVDERVYSYARHPFSNESDYKEARLLTIEFAEEPLQLFCQKSTQVEVGFSWLDVQAAFHQIIEVKAR